MDREQILENLKNLNAEEAEMLFQKSVDGMDYSDIAAEHAVSVGTVRGRLNGVYRALHTNAKEFYKIEKTVGLCMLELAGPGDDSLRFDKWNTKDWGETEPPDEPPIKPPVEPTVEPPPKPTGEPPIEPPKVPVVPPEPPIDLVPPAVPESQPRRFGWVAIVLGGVIVCIVLAGIAALFINWAQSGPIDRALTGGTDTPSPTYTSTSTETLTPTETLPPTATEDISPQLAAIQTGTAQALPTIDRISPALTATSARLTDIAPTETSTFTPTPTDTPTPTETPSPTPTADTSALDPSKEYSNEFASLTLDSWDFNSQIGPAGWRWNMAITFVFTYKNLSGQNILLRFAESDFTMKDDLGRTFECFDDDTWTGGFSHSLGLADQVSFKIGCARGHTIGPDVSSLILQIEDFSSMGNLNWLVEILG